MHIDRRGDGRDHEISKKNIIRKCSRIKRGCNGTRGQAGDWRMQRARGLIKRTSHSRKNLAHNVNSELGQTIVPTPAPALAS
ncbi:hypothetical protein EVAR_46641_1 [Eumeta japonica]|uniref:Uncharacterized protein n=1 Tax=Eumeta variegata TaxID=151549 RepID=A0A4C1WI29_EUMVA|nr:hypothetical protein EVAR_46641_1 [Eumeta japonica]